MNYTGMEYLRRPFPERENRRRQRLPPCRESCSDSAMRRAVVASIVLIATIVPALPAAAAPGAAAAPAAPGAPGALSHFDLARKDCLGTAAGTTSKVWYTVANGVLSDVYSPTIDN